MNDVLKPFAVGVTMAIMMLWMLHERIMSADLDLTRSVLAFVIAHVVVIAVIGSLALFIPRVRAVALRHRPSFGHVMSMAFGMAIGGGVIHLAMHGGFL